MFPVEARLLTGSTVALKFETSPTINDIKVSITKHFPNLLPPEVVVLTVDAKELSSPQIDDTKIIVPSEVYTIFSPIERTPDGAIWVQAFTAFAKASDVCGMRRCLPHVSDAPDSATRSTFYAACEDGNLDIVQAHLDAGLRWGVGSGRSPRTPLILCARNQQHQVMRRLLESGWDKNVVDHTGATALYTASRCGPIDSVNLLLDFAADINKATCNGQTPLRVAIARGHLSIARALLTAGANIHLSNLISPSLFVLALEDERTDAVELLLEHGYDKDLVDRRGWTPLVAATHYRRIAVANLLLKAGIKDRSVKGDTALWIAAAKGSFEIARLLLEHGSDPNATTSQGYTALYAAARGGHLNVVELLLDFGACKDGCVGYPPLYSAAFHGRFDVVKLLLEHGADINATYNNARTPLYIACYFGLVDIVTHLLVGGAEVDKPTRAGQTPLFAASEKGHVRVVKCLVEHGANTKAKERHGWTPLGIALKREHRAVSKLLTESVHNSAVPKSTASIF